MCDATRRMIREYYNGVEEPTMRIRQTISLQERRHGAPVKV
jgi:hypothetical protein